MSGVPDFKNVIGRSGHIDPSIVKEQMDYIKVRYRSEDPLEYWTHYNIAEDYEERARATAARLAKLDVLHQQQLQRRAIAAGIIDAPFDTINEEYAADYEYLRAKPNVSPIIEANLDAQYESQSDKAAGFPCLKANTYSTTSFMSSIDRWPASLLSKKMVRMAYEYPSTPLIITGLCDLYERDGIEGEDLKHPVLKPEITPEQLEAARARKATYVRPTDDTTAKYPAHFWTIEKLKSSPFAEGLFRLGDDDDGNPLRAKLKVFLQYLQSNKDDAPLYLFEDDLKRCRLTAQITKLYRVPSYFEQDLVTDVIPEHRRPPHIWMLVGPERSGTRMHTDPRNTSAWNTSVTGRKHWVLMRPNIPPNIVKGHVVMTPDEKESLSYRGNPPCAYWYKHILPRLRAWVQRREAKREARALGLPVEVDESDAMLAQAIAEANTSGTGVGVCGVSTAPADFGVVDDEAALVSQRAMEVTCVAQWDEQRDGYGWMEFIQYPHETIMVPSSWWHAVINLDATIAYTQNFTNQCNFPLVYRAMRAHTKRTTRRWLRKLKQHEPIFYDLARRIDECDGVRVSPWKGDEARSETDSEGASESESSSCISSFDESEE